MIRGVTVEVLRPTAGTADRFGNAVPGTPASEQVDNVLVSPGVTADLEASRPEGVNVAFTLHFPKGYTSSLEGCDITLPAPWSCTCHVIGNPTPYIDANTPTQWHMPVEVEVAHG